MEVLKEQGVWDVPGRKESQWNLGWAGTTEVGRGEIEKMGGAPMNSSL